MMPEIPRHLKITIGILLGAVLVGAIYFRLLTKRIYAPPVTEQKAVEHLAEQSLTSPEGVLTRVTLYLAVASPATSAGPAEQAPGPQEPRQEEWARLVVKQVAVPLADEPALRAKQLLQAWLEASYEEPHSLIPQDARVREVFIGPDGTAYVDFSSEFSTHGISGIGSEAAAVYAVVNTLTTNLNGIQEVKILVNGQEAETLAGHVDLDRSYTADLSLAPPPAQQPAPGPAPTAPSAAGAPAPH